MEDSYLPAWGIWSPWLTRLTQTMCIWRVSSTEGMLGKHKCHLSPKRESGDSHRESNFKREMDKKEIDKHFLSQGPSGRWLHESEFQIHYFSKYVSIGLPQLHCHMYLFLQELVSSFHPLPTWHRTQPYRRHRVLICWINSNQCQVLICIPA